MNRKIQKLGLVSSSGGHWAEILCLKELAGEYDVFFATEEGGQTEGLTLGTLYTHKQINRAEKWFLIKFIKLFIEAEKILRKERPDAVISTGALYAFPFCFLAKLHGKKVIYIESFARIHEWSLTGRLVYPFADRYFVQWEELAEKYPKAEYIGSIF